MTFIYGEIENRDKQAMICNHNFEEIQVFTFIDKNKSSSINRNLEKNIETTVEKIFNKNTLKKFQHGNND